MNENDKSILNMANLVRDMDEKERVEIAHKVCEGYKTDLQSRKSWEKSVDTWTKLALQVMENKTFPWAKASNVKYPLLSTAAMQFNARAYPSLVPANGQLVNVKVIGKDDEQSTKAKRAERVSKYMSYQLTEEMEEWEEEMDKLLTILPIVGTCFKKTYFDKGKERNVSKLILPKELVINYWAKTMEDAERKTEVISLSKRAFTERIREGVYHEYDEEPKASVGTATEGATNVDNTQFQTPPVSEDDTTPHIILEQHTYHDIDGDGYPEPVILTVHFPSQKLMRVAARFGPEDIKMKGDKITSIKATEYYTKYGFIPNPDGGFYDIGFGLLLGSINHSINTNINQLVDAGTLSNLQAGFLSRSLRMKDGEVKFKPGEWKWVNATGDALKNGVFPLPTREPSATLFKLLELLIGSGKELASVSEIFVGKMPGQNTPATTTMASIEQGMKLFTAIYKRVYRALTKEYKKLFKLNATYTNPETMVAVLDDTISAEDFDSSTFDIAPAADPSSFSSTQRLLKAQALMELIPLGTVDRMEVTRRILEAQEQPNIPALMPNEKPAPDPKAMEQEGKMKLEQAKVQGKQQLDEAKGQREQASAEAKVAMDGQMKQQEMQHKEQKHQLDAQGVQMASRAKMQAQGAEAQMKLATSAAISKQKIENMRQEAKNKPKPTKKA